MSDQIIWGDSVSMSDYIRVDAKHWEQREADLISLAKTLHFVHRHLCLPAGKTISPEDISAIDYFVANTLYEVHGRPWYDIREIEKHEHFA